MGGSLHGCQGDHGDLVGLLDDDHTQYQLRSEKAAASGYAGLGANSLVPTAQLGSGVADATTFLRGDQSYAVPSGGVTDHGLLTGLADDDHTQYGALAQAETWAALQTFSSGLQLAAAQAIKDSGGTARVTPATVSPHVTLAGAALVTTFLGIVSTPATSRIDGLLRIAPGNISNDDVTGMYFEASISPGVGNTRQAKGAFFRAQGQGAGTISTLKGVEGTAQLAKVAATSPTFTEAIGVDGAVDSFSPAAVTIPFVAGLRARVPNLFGTVHTITERDGLLIENQGDARSTTVNGLKVANITAGTTRRLADLLGLTTSNFRLDAGDPAANLSQLYIAVNNGAVVLRQIEIGAADSATAGFRTLRVAN